MRWWHPLRCSLCFSGNIHTHTHSRHMCCYYRNSHISSSYVYEIAPSSLSSYNFANNVFKYVAYVRPQPAAAVWLFASMALCIRVMRQKNVQSDALCGWVKMHRTNILLYIQAYFTLLTYPQRIYTCTSLAIYSLYI